MAAKSAIDYAKEQLGVKYVFGGETPGVEFDCSGLVQYSYGKAGIKLPRTAAQQQQATTRISAAQAKPGDLVFFGYPAHHVGIYLGNGEFLEAPHTGTVVKIAHFTPGSVTFGRVSGSNAATGRNNAMANASNTTTYQSYGYVATLANSVPDIKKTLNMAIAGNWSVARFQDQLQTTNWWKHNSDTAKKMIALSKADPAEFNQQVNNASKHVMAMAKQLGVAISASWAHTFAIQDLYQGLDDDAISAAIAANYHPEFLASGVGGRSVDLTNQTKALGLQYGVRLSDGWVASEVRKALIGQNGIEGIQQAVEDLAVSYYPTLATQLKGGQTTMQIAQPYMSQMSNLLEVPEGNISLGDPTIQKALNGQLPAADTPTGTPAQGGTGAKPTAATAAGKTPTTLYDFSNALRSDPRWDKTDNAKASAYTMLHQLGQTFGFAS
jgi:hypothetical protein